LIIKAILKILMLLLTSVLLCHCKKEREPRVDIPDNAFLKALIEEGVDTNGDSMISSEEAEAVISLNVGSRYLVGDEWYFRDRIKSLDGIEAFVNLS
jgi:hypothetical protein